MNDFLDTSVLVPAFYGDHIHHSACFNLFVRQTKSVGCCGAHSLAEVYSTLTRMPGKHRITGEHAMLFVRNICEKLTVISLTSDEYVEALEAAASRGVAGGTTYDALLARTALKSGAKWLYTVNLRHYAQFGLDITERLRLP